MEEAEVPTVVRIIQTINQQTAVDGLILTLLTIPIAQAVMEVSVAVIETIQELNLIQIQATRITEEVTIVSGIQVQMGDGILVEVAKIKAAAEVAEVIVEGEVQVAVVVAAAVVQVVVQDN